MGFDIIEAVETLYRTDTTSAEWLRAVCESIRPLVDPEHQGVQGGFYQSADACSFRPEGPVLCIDLSERRRAIFDEGLQYLGEDFIAGTFLFSGVTRGTAVEGWSRIPPVRDGAFHAHGMADVLNVVAIEPDGAGCGFGVFRSEAALFPKAENHLLRGFFRHFIAAHRLHRKLQQAVVSPDGAAAVFDSSGRLHHAAGAAAEASVRRALRSAVLDSERSRGPRRRRDPHAALDAWESLVAGRWSMVDHLDHDGRRYILAVENSPRACGLDLLSPREREVVERALSGSDNKVIAYDLGITHSTVKVLIARAAVKLGVRTRRELLDKLRREVLPNP
jgi:DNA-binding CsgD family transcriptional regulator